MLFVAPGDMILERDGETGINNYSFNIHLSFFKTIGRSIRKTQSSDVKANKRYVYHGVMRIVRVRVV